MIYLITGSPGTGKTSMVVDMILNNYEGLFKSKNEDGAIIDRPLYFCHIDGLKKEAFKAHELTEEDLQSAPLNELVPEGSVIIVDECDYTYPVRSINREVPPYVKTLKELRHHGYTLILMTQHPSMIDKYVRQLVGKHIHLERKQLGTKRYEWFSCQDSLSSATLSQGSGVFYTPSKKAFDYYKSASIHVKFQKKRDKVFYIFPILAILFVYLIYRSMVNYGVMKSDQVSETNSSHAISQSASEVEAEIADESKNGSVLQNNEKPPIGSKVSDYIPTVQSLPETKPLYDGLRNPINMETVSGCVSSRNSCNCYTEQATKVYVNEEMCRYWARNGVFQVYKNMQPTTSSKVYQDGGAE